MSMKLFILIFVVVLIAIFSLKNLYKFFKGESGCNCSSGSKGSCHCKDKCDGNKK